MWTGLHGRSTGVRPAGQGVRGCRGHQKVGGERMAESSPSERSALPGETVRGGTSRAGSALLSCKHKKHAGKGTVACRIASHKLERKEVSSLPSALLSMPCSAVQELSNQDQGSSFNILFPLFLANLPHYEIYKAMPCGDVFYPYENIN
mmetsp:Transcript_32707/g.75274  ORF Transcript_32707/g.75274 Transcript_32707/m.75274 type:complete len:149 (-) Transcript_32707:28-474(-)